MLESLQVQFDLCEHQRAQMLDMAADWSDAQLVYRPRNDAWCLLEELHHLALVDAETVRLASQPESAARVTQPMGKQPRRVPFFVVWLVMRCGIRVPVPVESVLPNLDQSLAEVAAQWELSREQLRSLLAAVEDIRLPFVIHPVCGPITAAQTLRYSLAHGQYHWRHMAAIRRGRSFPT